MEQEKSVDKQCHDVPLCAARVADILESAANRFAAYADKGISFATEPDMGNTMRLTHAIGSDLPDVLRWLRLHGHGAAAGWLDDALGKAAQLAADIDIVAKQAGGPRDSMFAVNLKVVTGGIGTELRQTARVIRTQVPEQAANPGKTAVYLFKCEGATWRIVYEGQETTVKNTKGVQYIHHLVGNVNKSVECWRIERACSNETPEWDKQVDTEEALELDLGTGTSNLAELDGKDLRVTLARVAHKKRSLEEELRATDDPAKKVDLQEQIGECEHYLNYHVSKYGTLRPSGPVEESRKRVSKAINTAKRAIITANGYIGKHFRAVVKADGTCFVYRPDRDIEWDLE